MRQLDQVLAATITGLGYQVVDHEFGGQGRVLRVFIERPSGAITLEDCERVTRQLQRVLAVEGIDYSRLEVSSPGLDRVLKKPADFRRFTGERADVRLRAPLNGRRRFIGVVRSAGDEAVDLEVDGGMVSLAYANMDRARLVPKL